MSKSKIEWTDRTWNPVTGCTKVSAGCANCYAERMAKRLRGRAGYPQDEPFKPTFHKDKIMEPFRWKSPSKVFVCSMSDLFIADFEYGGWIDQVIETIKFTPKHTYIILTKRPARAFEYFKNKSVPKNVWLGVSAENQQTADERIPILLQIPAAVRFVSCEPLLGKIDLYEIKLPDEFGKFPDEHHINCTTTCDDEHYYSSHNKIDWVICGGESGPGARPMHPDWARSLRDQCQAASVPFFFKQWGEWRPYTTNPITEPIPLTAMTKQKMIFRDNEFFSVPENMDVEKAFKDFVSFKVGKKAAGRLLDGKEHNEFPSLTTQY